MQREKEQEAAKEGVAVITYVDDWRGDNARTKRNPDSFYGNGQGRLPLPGAAPGADRGAEPQEAVHLPRRRKKVAQDDPGDDPAGEAAIRGDAILWGAPTFGQCEIGWRELQRACAGAAHFARNRMEVTFPSGGSVTFRSLDDPDNARGLTANGVVIDEAPLIQERAWYEVIRPIISDTDGWAMLMGTPKGKNFFWRESVSSKNRPDSVAFQAPTLGVRKSVVGSLERVPHPLENPFFKFEEAQLLADTMTEMTFQQEFLAQFVDSGGGVFRHITDAPSGELQDAGVRPGTTTSWAWTGASTTTSPSSSSSTSPPATPCPTPPSDHPGTSGRCR